MNSRASSPARTLICDLDGTLVDSAPDMAAALGDLLADLGRPPPSVAAVHNMIGDGVAILVERALAAGGETPAKADLPAYVANYQAYYERRLNDLTQPYPGAVATLTTLKSAGWRLAVCTNKPEGHSRRILAAQGFDGLFDAVAGGDTFAMKKPDPGHLHGVLGAMDAEATGAIMLGDSRNDVLAARGAGVPVVLLAHGYAREPLRTLAADAVIAGFAELPGALAALGDGW